MNLDLIKSRAARVAALACLSVLLGQSAFGLTISLEGLNKGDPINWSGGNLQNWQELDYIPCRVRYNNSPGSQTVRVDFEHRNGGFPGIQDLFNFTTSSNVVFVSPPVLFAPPTADTWSYSFTINILDSQPADVLFFARLAAGAHLNVGSSLALSGKPSAMGSLQIHKPAPGPGTPDLMVLKSGPAIAKPGDIITYVLSYTNKTTGFNPATGVQLSDILPAEVSLLTNSLSTNAMCVGNIIYWDLPNLPVGAGGQISFQVQINTNVAFGAYFTNFSQILSAENDLDYSDNTSILVTSTINCAAPSVAISPLSAIKCPGDTVGFAATANGTGPLAYQWRKDGAPIAGATGTSYSISPIALSDAGSYTVVVTNLCGTATSTPGVLVVNTNVSATPLASLVKCLGDSATFSTVAGGTGPFIYSWRKDGSLLAETNSALTIASVTALDSGTYSVQVSGACGSIVTNSATLTVNPPVTASPLVDLVDCPGDTAMFNTIAAGTGPFSFTWYKNGFVLAETNSSLTLANVTGADAGTYSVVVIGTCGNAVTNSASLTVNQNVIVATAPVSLTNCPGTSPNFSINATGTGLSYQWYKGSAALAGQTTSSLNLANISATDAGTYSVVITGTCGSPVTNS
ncbi:MAG TPA: hypothetical protein VN794_23785, partial [Methylomirabilota bacterium]|nr:hypothetical protein [Methylomirabilota bacterium]